MFAYIKGTLEEKGNNYVVIDVGGIGYKIFMSDNSMPPSFPVPLSSMASCPLPASSFLLQPERLPRISAAVNKIPVVRFNLWYFFMHFPPLLFKYILISPDATILLYMCIFCNTKFKYLFFSSFCTNFNCFYFAYLLIL